MKKTKEELEKLKKEYETMSLELKQLSEEELKTVVGGTSAEDHNIMLPEYGD